MGGFATTVDWQKQQYGGIEDTIARPLAEPLFVHEELDEGYRFMDPCLVVGMQTGQKPTALSGQRGSDAGIHNDAEFPGRMRFGLKGHPHKPNECGCTSDIPKWGG